MIMRLEAGGKAFGEAEENPLLSLDQEMFGLINLKASAKEMITDTSLRKEKHNEFQRLMVEDKFQLPIASLL